MKPRNGPKWSSLQASSHSDAGVLLIVHSQSYGPVPLVLSTTTRPDFITQRIFSLFENDWKRQHGGKNMPRARAAAIRGAFEQDFGAPEQSEGYPPPHIAPTVWIGHWQPGVALANPRSFAMTRDQQKQETADRVAQDDYPESFGFGRTQAFSRRPITLVATAETSSDGSGRSFPQFPDRRLRRVHVRPMVLAPRHRDSRPVPASRHIRLGQGDLGDSPDRVTLSSDRLISQIFR
jgi:hypothetical protein